MAEWEHKCKYLVETSGTIFGASYFKCELTGQEMKYNDSKIKFTCNADEHYQYEKCLVYQSQR